MLADIEWIYRTLSSAEGDFSKMTSREMIGRSLEFARGALWQRERDLKEIMDIRNKFSVKISRLRAQLALFKEEFEGDFLG